MVDETKWCAVVKRGRGREFLLGIEPQWRKRDVWAACLRLYAPEYREDPSDDGRISLAYAQLSKDWNAGIVRPVKVTISWENAR